MISWTEKLKPDPAADRATKLFWISFDSMMRLNKILQLLFEVVSLPQ